jgi:hypothetical protein
MIGFSPSNKGQGTLQKNRKKSPEKKENSQPITAIKASP